LESRSSLLLTDLGEVQVDHRRFESSVPQVSGDLANRSAAFKHVGGEAVTQRVDGKFIVGASEAGLNFCGIHRRPKAALIHGALRLMEGLAQGET